MWCRKGSLNLFVLTIVAAISFAVLNVGAVSAAHDTNVTITPDIANCGQLSRTYNVSVKNLEASADNIREVRIFDDVDNDGQRDPGIVDLQCGPAPTGWLLTDRLADFNYCQYETSVVSPNRIFPGQTKNFTFTATLNDSNIRLCGNEFKVATIDDKIPIGQVVFKFPKVLVDCTTPVIQKIVGDPKISGSGFDWWVTEKTLLTLSAFDNETEDKCNLGLDYCRYRITVDGVPGDWIFEENGEVLSWEFYFDEDSEHYLEVECYDKAGNKAVLTETDKVDSTPPETQKTYDLPRYPEGMNEGAAYPHWITTATKIKLDAKDGGDVCAIGIDKTWWYDQVVDERYCLSEEACLSWDVCPTPYDPCYCDGVKSTKGPDCVDNAQKICENIPAVCEKYGQTLGYASYNDCIGNITSWEDCVEEVVNSVPPSENNPNAIGCVSCDCQENWQLYQRTGPFQKPEESCHIIQYFSVDNIGNIETLHKQCVFVDNKPPVGEKTIGDPQVGGCLKDIAPESCDGWACLDGLTKDFFTTGRQDPTNWDLAIWKGNPDQIQTQGEFAWESMSHYTFSVSYNPSDGLVTYTVGDKTLTWNYEPGKAFEYIIPFAKGNANGNSVELTSLVLNGKSLPDVLSGTGYKGLKVFLSDSEQMNGFTLTGVATLIWYEKHPQEIPAFHIFAMNTHDPQDCWVRDHVTPITLDCKDQLPHPVDNEQVCYKVSFDGEPADLTEQYCKEFNQGGAMKDGWCCADVSDPSIKEVRENKYTFTFMEDSLHDLEYYCVDALGNKNQIDKEWFKVDSQPPIIEKNMFGSYLGDCPSGKDIEHGDCYVADNENSGVDVKVYDDTRYICAVDKVWCTYIVWWNTTKELCGDRTYDNGWCLVDRGKFTDMAHIVFKEDSTHKLVIHCEDALGNFVDHEELFLVDSTPPVTTKTIGQPLVKDGFVEWINSSTPITLNATDAKVGVDKMWYKDKVLTGEGELACANPQEFCNLNFLGGCPYCQNGNYPRECIDQQQEDCAELYTPQTEDWYKCVQEESNAHCCGGWDWTLYKDQPFYKPEESCHVLYYFSVDKLGNVESINVNCFYVDNKPPITDKLVGDPKVACQAPVDDDQCQDSKTYTLDKDFDEGVLFNMQHNTVHDQLQLSLEGTTTYPIMWVANAGEDTVSKWDTTNMKELARYHTWFGPKANHDEWAGPAPSRTAVDADGNVYVANRHFDGKPADVFKILADDWVDRDGDGIMDTSADASSNGQIEAGEMLQMTDSNTNGIIDTDEIKDERVAWVTRVGPNNCLGRSLAIDLNGDIWLGCYNTNTYYKLDGDTGAVLAGPISTPGHSPYGALVDKYGILWGASLGSSLLKLNTNTNAVTTYTDSHSNYGIAIGYDASGNTRVYLGGTGDTYREFNSATNTFSSPAAVHYYTMGIAVDQNGNIVAGGNNGVTKFAPNGTVIWTAPEQVNGEARGTQVDSDGNVWVIYRDMDKLAKYRGTDGAALGVVNSGNGPYTYSDATGLGFRGSVSQGTWNVIADGGVPDAEMGPVSWNANVPQGTELTVKVRSSNDQVSWSVYETVGNGAPFVTTPDGRYLEVQVSMKSTTETSPVLYDLTVHGGCGAVQPECWFVTQQTPITLNCNDQQPHPVDHSAIWYRYRVSDDCKTWGQWTNWTDPAVFDTVAEVTKTFTFPEDSCHELEYYCVDALGNKEPTQREIDIVDTKPPVIRKTMEGPWYGVCPPAPVNNDIKTDPVQPCYVDSATKVKITATDPEPHPVNEVTCEWRYKVNEGGWSNWTNSMEITFPEESFHTVQIVCKDALGNTVRDEEQFIADHTPPVTEKTYGKPFFNGSSDWITSATEINLSAKDPEPHPSGVKETLYRVTLMGSDGPCLDDKICQNQTGTGNFSEYEGSFKIGEESCHLIEYYSVDNVEKTEAVKKQCVFVDNKAPVPNKTVEEPKTRWDGADANFYDIADKCWSTDPAKFIECWRVTLDTKINLACVDQDPHPVDHNGVCFKVDVDGSDFTMRYCEEKFFNTSGDGYCCLPTEQKEFTFREETEHNLKYYCVDALGNTGPVDEEKFKVGGKKFEIPLCKKWNLISVPFVLLDDSPAAVFKDVPGVEAVWAYDGVDWQVWTPVDGDTDTLKSIEPGSGYWVLETGGCETLVLGGSLFDTLAVPPSKNLVKGWNLIGYYGTKPTMCHSGFKPDEAYCALNSLIDTQEGFPRWSSLWTYSNKNCRDQCDIWGHSGWKGLDVCSTMFAGRGYWIEIDVEDKYAPASVCVWNKDFPELQCVDGRFNGGILV